MMKSPFPTVRDRAALIERVTIFGGKPRDVLARQVSYPLPKAKADFLTLVGQ
jgi:hypothetical protein